MVLSGRWVVVVMVVHGVAGFWSQQSMLMGSSKGCPVRGFSAATVWRMSHGIIDLHGADFQGLIVTTARR
jgi:hypothetical protein